MPPNYTLQKWKECHRTWEQSAACSPGSCSPGKQARVGRTAWPAQPTAWQPPFTTKAVPLMYSGSPPQTSVGGTTAERRGPTGCVTTSSLRSQKTPWDCISPINHRNTHFAIFLKPAVLGSGVIMDVKGTPAFGVCSDTAMEQVLL